MYSEGKPPALISLWPSGNPFKRKPLPLRLPLIHGCDHSTSISYDSVSNLFLRDIPGRTEGTEGWSRSGHKLIGWGHFWKDLLLFLESGYLQLYSRSSHWVWLLGCSFALDRDSEYKLHCAVQWYLAHWEQSLRFITEEITTASIRCSAEFRNWHETPTPSHVAPSTGTLRSTIIRGQWERWRRKAPATNRKGYKSFSWIPQLKLFETDRFWAVFPKSLVVVFEKIRVFPISLCTVAIAQGESCPEASRKPSYPDTLREGQLSEEMKLANNRIHLLHTNLLWVQKALK